MEGVLVAAVTGLLSGAVGSLLAPWTQWGVEKRREKRAYRKRIVADLRVLARRGSWRSIGVDENAVSAEDLTSYWIAIVHDPDFVGAFRFWSPESVSLFNERQKGWSGGDGDFPQILFDEADRLERKWRLA